jgi:hypothetical protein
VSIVASGPFSTGFKVFCFGVENRVDILGDPRAFQYLAQVTLLRSGDAVEVGATIKTNALDATVDTKNFADLLLSLLQSI